MRKTVAMIAAVVVAVLAVVSARALTSPVAWATAAVLVVATAAAVATLSLTPAVQRVVVALGAILGLGAIALAVVDSCMRAKIQARLSHFSLGCFVCKKVILTFGALSASAAISS